MAGMAAHEISLEPDIAAVPGLMRWFENHCRSEAVEGDVLFKTALALEEAVVNVIAHAFDGRPPPYLLKVRLDLDPERIGLEILDNGQAFDPLSQSEPDLSLPAEQRQIGGLGIPLIRRMTDRQFYDRKDDLNRLRLEKLRR